MCLHWKLLEKDSFVCYNIWISSWSLLFSLVRSSPLARVLIFTVIWDSRTRTTHAIEEGQNNLGIKEEKYLFSNSYLCILKSEMKMFSILVPKFSFLDLVVLGCNWTLWVFASLDDNSFEVWLQRRKGVIIPLFCSAIDPRSARKISGAII